MHQLEDEIRRLGRTLLIVYLLETGLVLVIAPWSAIWERNLFLEVWPAFAGVMQTGAVRGSVSGVGMVCLGVGFWEIFAWSLVVARRRTSGTSRRWWPLSVEAPAETLHREESHTWPRDH